MFNIGDKIVYPGQGIGVIDCIEEREFKGEKQKFYKIDIFNSTMKLTYPMNRIEDSNIRLVSESKDIDSYLKDFSKTNLNGEDIKSTTAKERMSINSKRIKDGTLKDYLDVILNLSEVMNNGNINANEKQVLNSTKSLVAEEISQSKNISLDEAKNILDESLKF
ncbi:CarD family transcriptional regulator [Clostridium sp. D53t1_180928_C8]|uniref:CarD family transcriptional regulator n=1 Tax=Clostridium sp. D53t1_180928_C8 TaxID=2787101 RepID=UPI0018AAD0E6|nr:CarD family transcriptional regulator [Clostridium sp. D53t1_180928_C8]